MPDASWSGGSVPRGGEADRAALRRRERILAAVGTGAERLLRQSGEERLDDFLARIGGATGVSRAYIFENHRDERGDLVASQRFEWVAPGVPPQIDNPALQAASYRGLGMERWERVLGRGEVVRGGVDELPAGERELLASQGIRSLVVLPIFIGPEWWGFIGFDDTRSSRRWSRAEVDALRTSAGLVAAAIERDRAEERMQQLAEARAGRAAARMAERRSRFLAEAGRVLGSTLEYEAIFEQLARLVVPEIGEACVIDVLRDGAVRRVAVTHADPEEVRFVEDVRRSVPPGDGTSPITRTLRTGTPRIVPRITDAMICGRGAPNEPGIGSRSAIIVPLRAHGRVAAAMTILSRRSHSYGAGDLALADELAGRASLALEKARLYADARRATRVREQVLAVVSHDLRDPLHTIALSAGMLEESAAPEDPSLRRHLDIIRRSVGRADRLIDDLLDVARLEEGTFALERTRVSSVDVAREALDLHESQASAGRRRLVDELPERLPDVWADRDRLLQVFGNLLGNAIKFTPEGGRITLDAEPTDGAVRFRVTDTGPGVPADQLERLFDPFWQAARTREGAGLGLAIARGIVEAHGGRIRAESEVGRGTTLMFTIPAADEVGTRAGSAESAPDDAAG